MSQTHTPGPWSKAYIYGALRHIERNVDLDQFLSQEDQDDLTGEWVDERNTFIPAKVNAPSCRTNPADVSLIVAAPVMLKTLETVKELVCSGSGPEDLDTAYRLIEDTLKMARGGE